MYFLRVSAAGYFESEIPCIASVQFYWDDEEREDKVGQVGGDHSATGVNGRDTTTQVRLAVAKILEEGTERLARILRGVLGSDAAMSKSRRSRQ